MLVKASIFPVTLVLLQACTSSASSSSSSTSSLGPVSRATGTLLSSGKNPTTNYECEMRLARERYDAGFNFRDPANLAFVTGKPGDTVEFEYTDEMNKSVIFTVKITKDCGQDTPKNQHSKMRDAGVTIYGRRISLHNPAI